MALKLPIEIVSSIRDAGVAVALAKTDDDGSVVVAWSIPKSSWVDASKDFTVGDVLTAPPLKLPILE